MEDRAATIQHFPWSFRHVSRPFSGKLKVLEMLLARTDDQLKALTGFVESIEKGGMEADFQKLWDIEKDARQAINRLDAQCLKALAREELRASQRVQVASILRCSGSLHNAVSCFHHLCAGLILIRDEYSQTAVLHDLGSEALRMLSRAMEAFRTCDSSLAQAALEQEAWFIHLARSFHSRSIQSIFRDEDNLGWVTECHSVVHYWEGLVGSAMTIAREVMMLQTSASHSPPISAQLVVQ